MPHEGPPKKGDETTSEAATFIQKTRKRFGLANNEPTRVIEVPSELRESAPPAADPHREIKDSEIKERETRIRTGFTELLGDSTNIGLVQKQEALLNRALTGDRDALAEMPNYGGFARLREDIEAFLKSQGK